MFAYDFPLLGVFWAMLLFFLWVVWIILLVRTVFDIFRSDDMGGFGKATWLLFVVVLPYLGVFAYLIVRGAKMGQREFERANAHEEHFRQYVREVAGTGGGGRTGELSKLADLRDRGVLSEDEFLQEKARILA